MHVWRNMKVRFAVLDSWAPVVVLTTSGTLLTGDRRSLHVQFNTLHEVFQKSSRQFLNFHNPCQRISCLSHQIMRHLEPVGNKESPQLPPVHGRQQQETNVNWRQ